MKLKTQKDLTPWLKTGIINRFAFSDIPHPTEDFDGEVDLEDLINMEWGE